MKDINFFSVYKKRSSDSTNKSLKAVLIIAVIVLLVGGSYFGLSYYQNMLKNETARINTYLNSGEAGDKLAAIEQYKAKESLLDQYSQMISDVLRNLKSTDYINAGRLDKISASLPAGVTMQSIDVQSNAATFVFNVADMATVSQLAAALSALDSVQSVTLNNIDSSDSAGLIYTVTFTAALRGGSSN